ncbi:MAG: NAD-dependent epimerase/dehydratase family protein [Filomicrobium sp.]
MAGQRVFVTGANGFVGRALVGELAAQGFQVRAGQRSQEWQPGNPHVDRVAMPDLAHSSSPDVWQDLLSGCDAVVHLAGLAHSTSEIPVATYARVNGEAVGDIAKAASAAGVKRFVFLSSVRAQTGACAEGVLDEMSPPHPTDAYGRAKLAGEQALSDALSESSTEWVTLRPVLVYGPGVKGNMGKLMDLAAVPAALPIKSLRGRRSILSIQNLTAAIHHCLTSPNVVSQTFLIADLAPMDVGEIVTALRFGLKRKPSLFSVPTLPLKLAASLVGKGAAWQRLNGDLVVSTEAIRETGFKPVIGSNRALADMAFAENIRRGDKTSWDKFKRLLVRPA